MTWEATLLIRLLNKDEWPDLAPSVLRGTDEIAEVKGGGLGWVGIVWTSFTGREAFMWYVPRGKPTVGELKQMRALFDGFNASLWMTIDRTDAKLVRWARFMRLELVGPYDGVHDKYRRR